MTDQAGVFARVALAGALCCAAGAAWAAKTTETILLLRHGEKPAAGLGQLDCQGLNRALALPRVLAPYGRPDVILAPDPAVLKRDDGVAYAYVRPLATIEPTAIALGLPVDTSLGYADVAGLRRVIDDPAHRGAILLVSWEHHVIVDLLKTLASDYHGPAVQDWPGDDFDRLEVVHLVRDGGTTTMHLDERREGLDGLPAACPGG